MRQLWSAALVLGLATATWHSPFAGTRTGDSQQAVRIKIMSLGDSITFGTPDPGYGGYRRLLSTLLARDGYTIAFVGSERNTGSGLANEGHPGWTIAQIKDGIDSQGWLTTYQPDIILLHIGTNDIRGGNGGAAPDSLSALLDDILMRLPRTQVVVAEIIPFRQGLGPAHRSYDAAVMRVAAAKGARVSVVDMTNILDRDDYADGIHPNPGGYDKMARTWEPAIRAVISGSTRQAKAQSTDASGVAVTKPPLAGAPPGTAMPAATAVGPVIRYVPGSTVKLQQVVGEVDKERHQPTLSRTVTRYGLEGTDLGYSFEHNGRVYFLFGDTVGRLRRALDTIGTTDSRDPETGVRLDFLTAGGGEYLTIQPPGISMGAFEVPVTGISLGAQMYVAVSTNHSADRTTDRSVLTRFTPPAKFQPLRTISQLPGGRFIKMSVHLEPGAIVSLPSGGPFVIVWGTGQYRQSDAYLSIVPVAEFESGKGTRYFAGLDQTGAPNWSDKESDSAPIVQNGTLGDLSVTWSKDLGVWLMTYDRRAPRPGVAFSYSPTPWGPWSEPQEIFNAARDGVSKFIHRAGATPDDGLAGPVIGAAQRNPQAVQGGAYAPYVVERWTKLTGPELSIYYVLSTWNPYVVVLMKSRLQVDQPPGTVHN
jgi:lysophospholipase L1-like esterase